MYRNPPILPRCHPIHSPFSNHHVAAERADRQRRAAVAEGRVQVVRAAIPGPPPFPSRTAESPPMVNGRSDRIDPLKLLALSSKPAGLASISRTEPECELIS